MTTETITGVEQKEKYVKTENRETYFHHVNEASKPISERMSVSQGREGLLPPRRHHLLPEQQDALLRIIEKEGSFRSPFKKFGAYDGLIASLILLGENENHGLGDVLTMFEKYMSGDDSKDSNGFTAWDRFRNKKSRSQKTGLDYVGRLRQNIAVLQRMGGEHPYALKLAQLGCCVDITKGKQGEFRVCLRTGIAEGLPVSPINEFKSRDCPRSISSIPSRIRFSGTTKRSKTAVSENPSGKVLDKS